MSAPDGKGVTSSDVKQVPLMTGRRCENCTRERADADLFWHRDDRAWYCNDPFGCEARLGVLIRRGRFEDIARIDARDESKAGVSWLA